MGRVRVVQLRRRHVLMARARRPGTAQLVRTIRHVHARLEAAANLRPSRSVDQMFRRLVDIASRTPDLHATVVLADPSIRALAPRLIQLCAQAELELELVWARRIGTSRLPLVQLARFPYLDNYQQLIELEQRTLNACGERPPRRILFVGAGPLPLSALLLARRLGTPVDCIDIDARAVRLASGVATRLGHPHLGFRRGDLLGCVDLSRYDLVVLAALVGLTPDQKGRILDHLHQVMAPGALLLARSAHGLKTLLYPPIEVAQLRRYEIVSITHPRGPVINSILLARKP